MTIFQTGSNQKKLTDYAARLRHNPPVAERKFRHAFREGLPDIAIRHQVVIAPYIVDFLLPDHNIIIELDGDTHDPEQDKKRDNYLKKKGYYVLRFSNELIYNNMNGVLEMIDHAWQNTPLDHPGWSAYPIAVFAVFILFAISGIFPDRNYDIYFNYTLFFIAGFALGGIYTERRALCSKIPKWFN